MKQLLHFIAKPFVDLIKFFTEPEGWTLKEGYKRLESNV